MAPDDGGVPVAGGDVEGRLLKVMEAGDAADPPGLDLLPGPDAAGAGEDEALVRVTLRPEAGDLRVVEAIEEGAGGGEEAGVGAGHFGEGARVDVEGGLGLNRESR